MEIDKWGGVTYTITPYKITPVNKYGKNEGATKSSVGKHHRKNQGN